MENPSASRTVRRAFGTVLTVALLGALFAALLLSVLNDVYAFVKPELSVTVTVEAPMSLSALARRLESEGIVWNPHVFMLYVRLRGQEKTASGFVGCVELNARMSYREILRALAQASSVPSE